MLILAVDTTSRTGSLAIWRDGRLTHALAGDPSRTHGERLPGDVSGLLSQAAVTVADIDLYAVVTGPGSFTGLRVGIAAVQGLALASGRKVVPIPALDAFASAPGLEDGRVAVWRDAQRQQVFAALYDRTAHEPREALAAVSRRPAEVVQDWLDRGVLPDAFIGDGVDAYAEHIRKAWPGARLVMPAPALAPIAATLAASRVHMAIAPHAVVPIYVRAADAELARERTKMKNER